jgi:hypothetical protein
MPSLKRKGVGGGEGKESLEKHVPAVFSTRWGQLPTALSYAAVRNKIHAIAKEIIGAKVYIYKYICIYIICLLQHINIHIYVLYRFLTYLHWKVRRRHYLTRFTRLRHL